MVIPRFQGAPRTATINSKANFSQRIAHTKYGSDHKLEDHSKEVGLALGVGKIVVISEELSG